MADSAEQSKTQLDRIHEQFAREAAGLVPTESMDDSRLEVAPRNPYLVALVTLTLIAAAVTITLFILGATVTDGVGAPDVTARPLLDLAGGTWGGFTALGLVTTLLLGGLTWQRLTSTTSSRTHPVFSWDGLPC